MIENTVLLSVRRYDDLIESERLLNEIKQDEDSHILVFGGSPFTQYQVLKRDKVLVEMNNRILSLTKELEDQQQATVQRRLYRNTRPWWRF